MTVIRQQRHHMRIWVELGTDAGNSALDLQQGRALMIKEFRDFIARGNVMDMAVGIIIGAAFTAIVTSMVSDLINPIIGIITGGTDFSDKY
ncbi:MAG: large conductance mechanosensitive channel protein MscL, partial [Paracoccus sp. (in: a-proteobacteria)]|nr:large conductance mechanosensitive channel protein MscL [Paracoccus sp. (in: a-proteobacteria)]